MSHSESPFLAVPVSNWLCSNELAFAIFDGFPVSPGHVLVTTRRIVETWFDASDEEQSALMALVKESKRLLDLQLSPKPDACNVASPLGSEENQILPLLRGWFGENAGAPGTNCQVAFTRTETSWSVEPVAVATPLRVVEANPDTGESDETETQDLPGFVEAPAAKDKFTRLVPVYSLEAAAGLWGPESSPEEIG